MHILVIFSDHILEILASLPMMVLNNIIDSLCAQTIEHALTLPPSVICSSREFASSYWTLMNTEGRLSKGMYFFCRKTLPDLGYLQP